MFHRARFALRFTGPVNLSVVYIRLRAAFWLVPTLCVVAAMVAAPTVAAIDAAYSATGGVLFSGGPDSARQILGVIASSVLTFAGLVFSITIVALQLASTQFSPRVLRAFLRDRHTQVGLGVFVGTYTFALLTLREVRGPDVDGQIFVPGLGVTVAVGLALASVATLMVFIHHMAQSVRVVVVIDRIAAETVHALDALYPADPQPRSWSAPVTGPTQVVAAHATGVLAYVDVADLVSFATDHDATVELLVEAGTYVIRAQPLFRVTGDVDPGHLHNLVGFESEREVSQDPAYGFRQLVDIGEKAISPAVNDPTTAVQCIDRIHALLRRIVDRRLDVGDHAVAGVLRMRVPVPGWADYLALACDELRHWGADAPRIQRRLETMLLDLAEVAVGDRLGPVDDQLELLRTSRRAHLPEYEWDAILGPGDPAERPLPSDGQE